MFRLQLFRIRAFTAGVLSSFLAAVARGGLMFMMIIWLQGVRLPEHGYSFSRTPLWAGICMLPLTAGFLIAGPVSGYLSDRFGSRPFASGGMLVASGTFILLELLPIDFTYWQFALLLLLNGLAMGAFAAPNRAGIMNSLPPQFRGAGSGMNSTFQNSAQVLSIGIFFTLVIIGLSATLPASLSHGLISEGIPRAEATQVANLPPVSTLFAAFLGYSPLAHLLPAHVLAGLTKAQSATVLGRSFFPGLIAKPFGSGLDTAFDFAAAGCFVAACASWARGKRYVYRPATPAGALAGSGTTGDVAAA
jgi:MFS family permease